MSTKIGGLDGSPVPVGKGGSVKRSDATADGAQASKTQSTSDTQITASARQLAALEQSMRDLPAIDQARVDQVSERLQNGNYRIDADKIAGKLLQLEQELDQEA